ncbi:hypothetical protein [Flavobacterium sp. UBA7680]|uniref:hypothetical protein n=1 Tax=Flavobacterium sp. UBA7680 TaxID=1946559 RepID=UPI0025BC39D7|nr:hypothetical protein [Flavobacterium sp. UBA7680]
MQKIIIILMFVLISVSVYSQETNSNINLKINEYLIEFRKTIDKDAFIFIMFDHDFESINLHEHDYIISPSINPKKVKGNKNYMVKFVICNENSQLVLKGINFKINVHNRKKIDFINLMNGISYKL